MKFPCPCCGQPVTQAIDPYRLIDHLSIGGIARAMARILAANFRRDVHTALIVDCLYASTKNGGPMSAREIVGQTAHQLRKVLKPYGLTVTGTRSQGGQYRLDWIDGPVISMRHVT